MFLVVLSTSSSAQSSCGGYTYELKKRDIPKGFEFVQTYLIDSKQGTQDTVKYTYVSKPKDKISLTISNACNKLQNIQLDILDVHGNIVASNNQNMKLKRRVYFTFSKSGIYYFRLSFRQNSHCRNCGDAILAVKR